MSSLVRVAAVDLGASSGRVVLGRVDRDELALDVVARFPNGPVERADGLHWDLPGLVDHARAGLTTARERAGSDGLAAIAVDAWAVDYGLLRQGTLLDLPWCYRDARGAVGVERVHAQVPAAELYRRTGLQFLDFTTIYQLATETRLGEADRLLLVPDLVTWALTGEVVCERTNASTTGLLTVSGEWDDDLLGLVGLHRSQLGPLTDPGTVVGDHEGVPVVTVGSHDTASAVVGVPMSDPSRAAYVSCGTWGLVGVEIERPVLTDAASAANFTHEGGVDGRIRFLTNVMGTWMLSETLRTWGRDDLPALLAAAADHGAPVPLVDVQDPRFVPPGDMPGRIAAWCEEHDRPVPADPVALVRCIVESLAAAFASAVRRAADLTGRDLHRVHVVGGGARNDLLCRLLAERLGLPVHAGPVEATALGNVLVQARATGAVSGSLETLRDLVARTQDVVVHHPTPRGAA